MQSITLNFSDAEMEKLKLLQKGTKLPLEQLLVHALNQYKYQEHVKKIKRSLKPYAEKAGMHTEEDLFEAVS